MQPQDFENRLKAQVDFPSPSRVAEEIIALARDPDIEMAKVAQAVGRDPAMTAKILRIANSAFYAQRRPSQNLRQALVEKRGWFSKIWAVLLLVSAAILLWVAFAFNLIGFGTNY